MTNPMNPDQIQRLAEWHAKPQWMREAVILLLLRTVGDTAEQVEYAEKVGCTERARYLRHHADSCVLAAMALGYVAPDKTEATNDL